MAPSCTDCHGAHDIYRDSDPRSHISHLNVPKTCGKCHVGVDKVYDQSIHDRLAAKKDPRGPVCVNCHTSHKIVPPTKGVFKLESDERCGKCHQDRLRRYRESYHGKAIALGQTQVAACFDCHGHHDVQRASDPRSHLSPKNKLGTCQKCHPGATAGFTGYQAHADHTSKKDYPLLYYVYISMTTLLLGVFGFFGLHTLLWFVRSLVLLLRNPKAFREAREKVRRHVGGKIFSGRISEEEMLHERRRLYDRLQREGRLEQEKLTDEWERWKRIFNPIGMLAFLIGVVLIVGIYIAMAQRLTG